MLFYNFRLVCGGADKTLFVWGILAFRESDVKLGVESHNHPVPLICCVTAHRRTVGSLLDGPTDSLGVLSFAGRPDRKRNVYQCYRDCGNYRKYFKYYSTFTMNKTLWSLSSRLVLIGIVFGCFHLDGQITVDDTLGGTTKPLQGPNYQITQDLGFTEGTNLFHSFQEFNLTSAESAVFSGTGSIQNILARVTGRNPSNIDGTIRSEIAGANLFFMNPNGVILGPNAELDVSGSVILTSADAIDLGAMGSFSASNPLDSVLSSAPPTAFGFLQSDPGGLSIDGSILTVQGNNSLSVIGGDVTIEDAEITASTGDVNIVSVDSAGEMNFSQEDGSHRVEINNRNILGDVALLEGTHIGSESGGINIDGHDVTLSNVSISSVNTENLDGKGIHIDAAGDLQLTDGTEISTVNISDRNGGDITLTALTAINIAEGSQIGSLLERDMEGSGGAISVEAKTVKIVSGAALLTITAGRGDGGAIRLTGTDQVILDAEGGDASRVISRTVLGGANGGDVVIETTEFMALGGSLVNLISEANGGNGGSLKLSASKDVLLEEGSSLRTQINIEIKDAMTVKPKGGDIDVETGQLHILNDSRIRTTTFGNGQGGNIRVMALTNLATGLPGLVKLDDSQQSSLTGIFTQTGAIGPTKGGDGGNISILTDTLLVVDGAQIKASSSSGNGGDSGNVTVVAHNDVVLDGSRNFLDEGSLPLLATQTESSGSSGTLSIETKRLDVINGGQILANSTGLGEAGDLKLTIGERLLLDGGNLPDEFLTIIGAPLTASGGKGGSVVIDAPSGVVDIRNGAQINTNGVEGSGGGDIDIDADTLTVEEGNILANTRGDDAGTISISANDIRLVGVTGMDFGIAVRTAEGATGDGGSVQLDTGSLLLSKGARITSESKGAGDAGPIDIVARKGVVLDNSDIVAEASNRNGGNIVINSKDTITVTNSANITALAVGDGGNITLTAAERINAIDSKISAEAGINGGDINMGADSVFLNASSTIANAMEGDGGNISITAKGFLESVDNVIDASSQFGVSGNIEILSPDVDISGSLAVLPESFASSELQLQESCAVKLPGNLSSFITVGRGGVPLEPGGVMPEPASP